MSIMSSAPVAAEGMARRSRSVGPAAMLKGWWAACLARRIERAAILQLGSMSDRELKDIGLTRSQIVHAVRGGFRCNPLDRLC